MSEREKIVELLESYAFPREPTLDLLDALESEGYMLIHKDSLQHMYREAENGEIYDVAASLAAYLGEEYEPW